MPEKPKTPEPKPDAEPVSEKRDEKRAWAADQEKHEYYYDDAHGYEVYEPGEDDDADAEPLDADARV